jgi:hypothetical protein
MDAEPLPNSSPDPDPPDERPRPLTDFVALLTETEAVTLDAETDRILERRARVAEARARRKSIRQIADEVKCSVGTVHHDLDVLRRGYLRLAAVSTAEHVAQALQDLEARYQAAWAAWERSCGEKTETTTERRDGRLASAGARVKRMQRDGDPRWAAAVRACWTDYCLLMGLFTREDLKAARDAAHPPLVVGGEADPGAL